MWHRLYFLIVSLLSTLIVCVPAEANSCKPLPKQQFVVTPPFQQTIVTLPVAPPYYFSVGSHDQVKEIVKETIKQYREELLPAVEPQDEREMFKLFGNKKAVTKVDDGAVLAVFDNTCVKCHKPGSAKPGVQLLTEERQLFVNPDQKKELARRKRVYESIESGEMPKGLGPLTPEQKAVIESWSKR